MTIPADLFRDVFSRWPTGAGVLTARVDGQAHGMVVGSFCSLSADPPLAMVSLGRVTRMHDLLAAADRFAVSILGAEQRTLLERFAGLDRRFDADRFTGLTTIETPSGLPVFPGALAWAECRLVAQHPGANYTIFVGELVEAGLGDAAEASPLLYFRRRVGSFAARDN
ncbi:MAG: Nitrilotriacetate monooxygenase component B [uncultured Thermomicrobiales bacterium]|uniref:Nitrilotriacetate monooxygenase component B n=1 Tax=uncultured Thermomicrobiales bacterium TaxID=1645740 RepID=A0A6J4TQV6_9BACT|nr:MAG: Nitrilotriacetate monooxygenase component B [uncultured Thermomicrobiales bacterium]